MRLILSFVLTCLAVPLLGTILGEGMAGSGAHAEQPNYFCGSGRVCNAVPGQSLHTTPVGYYDARGSYHDNGNHRRRNVVRIIDVAQVNPAYVSSYSPDGYDSATQADILAQIRTLSARLDQHVAQTAAANTGKSAVVVPSSPQSKAGAPATHDAPTVVVVPPATPGTSGGVTVVPPAKGAGPGGAAIGLSVVNAKCSQCHQAGKLSENQRFTILDSKGNLVSLTDKQKLNMLQRAYHAEMPPPTNARGVAPLTDSEFAALADLLR